MTKLHSYHPDVVTPLESNYQAILDCCTSLIQVSYYTGVAVMFAKLAAGEARIAVNDTHLLYIYRTAEGRDSGVPYVLPTEITDPRRFLEILAGVIHQFGGVTGIPRYYARSLVGWRDYRALPRPNGILDFVYSTKALADLSAPIFKKDRSSINSLVRAGYHKVPFNEITIRESLALEDTWKAQFTGAPRTYRYGHFTACVVNGDYLADVFGVRGFGIRSPDGRLVGGVLASKLTHDYWVCSFRYADRTVPGLSVWLWHLIALEFLNVPYEVDGECGKNEGLQKFKARFVTEDVAHLQLNMFTVYGSKVGE